ncbi:hypothetical protein [Pseudomonas sp. NPDC007930]|uniref:hypothetical protein n=1 Tax=Pseudomonas sp. NPDC007930 TaxID=3364417 RepID=UPI0036EF031A
MKRIALIGLLCLPLCTLAHATAALPAAVAIAPVPLLLAEAGTGQVPPKAQPIKKTAPAKKAVATKKTSSKPAAKKTASKSSARKQADTVANTLPAPKLDLSLPKNMVDKLEPEAKLQAGAAPKPVLPKLFEQKQGREPFELNGRLLSNEMDLNLRNDARKDVDGAALDFKFSQ